MLTRLFKEPLVHFVVLAFAIFIAYGVLQPSEAGKPGRVVVTDPKIEQMAALFAKTWQRAPTVAELKGLIDDHVKEEIFVREALALGLDKDDAVIRRRLRSKMEFMIEAAGEVLPPTDAKLDAYLKANTGKFEIDPMIAFEQVYLDRRRRGDAIERDAASVLQALLTEAAADAVKLGDITLLPFKLAATSQTSISRIFGREFALAITSVASDGQWQGPIKSTFGLHIIRVTEHVPGRIPPLAEIRDVVAREWANDARKAFQEAHLEELLKRYEVIIGDPLKAGASR